MKLGYTHGDIEKFLAPFDSKGQRCGLDSGLEDKKYLMFFDITQCLNLGTSIKGCPTPQVCVRECPTETILFETILTQNEFSKLKSNLVCTSDVIMDTLTYDQALGYIKQKKCASYVVKSHPVLQRCLMDVKELMNVMKNISQVSDDDLNKQDVANKISALVNIEQLSVQIVQDLVQSRWYMAGALVAVLLLCFLYILLLRWVVTPVVWASIATLIGALGFSLYLCYKNYVYYRDNPVSLNQNTNLMGYAQSIFSKKETWLVVLIVVAVILGLLLLIVIFLRNRITIAIALIQEGSKAITSVKTTVFFPILPCILQCCIIAYGVIVLLFIMSMGDPAFKVVNLKNDNNCNCGGLYTQLQMFWLSSGQCFS